MQPRESHIEMHYQSATVPQDSEASNAEQKIAVALLTGGSDRPYVFGLSTELISKGVVLDLIGSDELDSPDFHNLPGLNFFRLRGDQRSDASFVSKVSRMLKYYSRLIRYSATAKPRIFHILWNNKFETIDRTLLMLYYKSLGRRIVLTAHNVNAAKRDSTDTLLNRLTLRMQYLLTDRIFVHTEKAKLELNQDFGVPDARITVIPSRWASVVTVRRVSSSSSAFQFSPALYWK